MCIHGQQLGHLHDVVRAVLLSVRSPEQDDAHTIRYGTTYSRLMTYYVHSQQGSFPEKFPSLLAAVSDFAFAPSGRCSLDLLYEPAECHHGKVVTV